MDNNRKETYDKFKSCVTIVTLGDMSDWDEECFEDIYEDFCKDVYNEKWKQITDEELEIVQKGLKTALEIQARIVQTLAEDGYDALANMEISDDESRLLSLVNIDSLKIEDTENTLIKFLIWCNNIIKRADKNLWM